METRGRVVGWGLGSCSIQSGLERDGVGEYAIRLALSKGTEVWGNVD